ncbi:MAG TPA: sortase [Candidatus Eisenbacteria bacterium]|jgi:LPXTG-site transpeptidase (sortase) family protein|nr:sortase [Candidatus Eisenbacteria bacterium]
MMRRNLIAGLLIASGLALAGSAFWTMHSQESSASAPLVQMLPSTDGGGSLQPRRHQNPTRQLAPTAPGPNDVIAKLTIPRLAITGAPIFDRGLDSKGSMLIAHGYAVTHYAFSAGIGSGNAVLYGHDDIEGSIFARLKDLQPGDEIDVAIAGRVQRYRVSTRVIVAPTAVQILDPTADVRLTLFTCWPNWVDTQRVVITAVQL